MLERIVPPTCIVCDYHAAKFKSSRWPSVVLCGGCAVKIRTLFLKKGWANRNPFFFEIARPYTPTQPNVFTAVDSSNGKEELFTVENPEIT